MNECRLPSAIMTEKKMKEARRVYDSEQREEKERQAHRISEKAREKQQRSDEGEAEMKQRDDAELKRLLHNIQIKNPINDLMERLRERLEEDPTIEKDILDHVQKTGEKNVWTFYTTWLTMGSGYPSTSNFVTNPYTYEREVFFVTMERFKTTTYIEIKKGPFAKWSLRASMYRPFWPFFGWKEFGIKLVRPGTWRWGW